MWPVSQGHRWSAIGPSDDGDGPVGERRMPVEICRDLGLEVFDPAAQHAQVGGDVITEKRVSGLSATDLVGCGPSSEKGGASV
jgi:hypothetical protein